MENNLDKIKKEYQEVINQLRNPELISNWEKFEILSKKKKSIDQILSLENELETINQQIEEDKSILKSEQDKELISLADAEINQLKEKEVELKKRLEKLIENYYLSPEKEEKKKNSVIMEIRAGTGGEEAALFAGDLFRMYSKYSLSQGWKVKILDSHSTELGGFKEIIFEILPDAKAKKENNTDIFSKMQYEAGVHRVQRIPETEKSGRIHTSTATVAVLLKPKESEIKIKPDELKIDFYHSSGPGGQNVNKRMTAVRITHLPTGIVVTSQNERSQLQNKQNALAILEARLLEKQQQEEELKIGKLRREQIGSAKRAEKIRTYNFPQDRVTDHRIKKSWHNIEKIIEGEIEEIIKALIQEAKKQKNKN